MYTEARLGQLWQVLTPLLNSAVYYLIFGVLFKANRGISNYTAHLVTGVFIFAFTERSIVVGSSAIRANITLIRALHFPRACLPLAYVLVGGRPSWTKNPRHPFVVVLPGVHDPLVVTERRQGADHRRGLHEVRPRPEHVRDGCAHRILSVHLDPLASAAVTTLLIRRGTPLDLPITEGLPASRALLGHPSASSCWPPRSAGGTRPPTRSGRCCWPGGCCPPRCVAGSGSPGHTGGPRCFGGRGSGTRRWPPWPPRPGA